MQQTHVIDFLKKRFLIERFIKNVSVRDYKEELQQRNLELEVLKNASDIFSCSNDFSQIADEISDVFKKVIGCDRTMICLYQKDEERLVCVFELGDVILGEKDKTINQESSLKRTFDKNEYSMKNNEFIKSRNVFGDKITLPLNHMNEKIGVIFLESSIPNKFKNVNIDFLFSISNYAAIAIKNSELFSNVYLQKQEIEALYQQASAVNEQLYSYINELNQAKDLLRKKNLEMEKFNNNMQQGYIQTVMSLANAIEAKDAYTRGHCQRVMEISCEIAGRMGLSEKEIDNLRFAAILHDIGKIGIPATILNKRAPLAPEEFEEIKKHPTISYNILKEVNFIQEGLEGVLQHHERYDGKGYPYGLKGEQISIYGRILCIADAFDAMTTDRPYRKALSLEMALREIDLYSGTQFDPDISRIFSKMLKELISHDEIETLV